MKPSAYALGFAFFAAFTTVVGVCISGLVWWIKLGATLVLAAYWFYWWRQQTVRWCVLYPRKVVLGYTSEHSNRQSVVCSTEQISYWGICFVVGKHCVWRDQITPHYWRYLHVLKRW